MDKKTILIEMIKGISDADLIDYLYILTQDVCQGSCCESEQERFPAEPD